MSSLLLSTLTERAQTRELSAGPSVCGRPHGCKRYFDRLGAAVRCFRVSGLLMRPFSRPLACMEFAGQVHSAFHALEALGHFPGFPGPVSLTVRHTSRRPFASSTPRIAAG